MSVEFEFEFQTIELVIKVEVEFVNEQQLKVALTIVVLSKKHKLLYYFTPSTVNSESSCNSKAFS